jgi:hypothetical protein
MSAIKALGAPADPDILLTLQHALYRSDRDLTPEQRVKIISAAAASMTEQSPPLKHVLQQRRAYEEMRDELLANWGMLPFESRMLFREMVIHINAYQRLFMEAITDEDRTALVKAMPPDKREVFLLSLTENRRMADEIQPLIEADEEVKAAPTSDGVWEMIKSLDPGMEEALRRSLDRSNYVERDLQKTPRRRTG